MDIRRIAADNIRIIRQKRGLSQEALAGKAGISVSYVGYIERAEKSISITKLEKIARVLKTTPSALIERDTHRKTE